MFDDFLNAIGIKATDIAAGFAGGVVNAFVFRRSDPWAIIGSVVVGTLTAAYLGPAAPTYIGMKPSAAATFIVGLGGMSICQGIAAALKNWRPTTRGPVGEHRTD